jgi:hypothetical protein
MDSAKTPSGVVRESIDVVAHPPEFEVVEWRKDPALRRLYILCAFGLLAGSATTGYDG